MVPSVQHLADQASAGQAASKQGRLEQVEKELVTVSALVKDPKLSTPRPMGLPVAASYDRAWIRTRISSGTEILVPLRRSVGSQPYVRLVYLSGQTDVMANNSRLTSDVISTFSKMMSAHRGDVICTVTTAQSLDAANLKDLNVALIGFLAKGETLKLETKSDPSILGGMIVSIRDKYVDMSTKTKIQKLTKIIRKT
ncbi:ATP synthase subunit O, mitochondrial-like [Coregonus clupeaformis]|uniref:ATP synthase subunit O, mitochondrial-like n=1 Tax=Coregonus clupeaformis TaxID=59861 RepID=UPI001E1C9A6D|nr:ATP synthase subunit O, mitochondrial-like [Coregonus clupeaformis]